MTSDKTILGWIRGVKIPFYKPVVQLEVPPERKWSLNEQRLINEQLLKLLSKGVIKEVGPERGQFLSNIFLVPKPDGSHRLILNLKKLNKFIKADHFKLEDGKCVRKLLSRGWFMASIDLKDAYYLVPIAKTDQKFLKFKFMGKLYGFVCLPFGLSVAPYIYTKLMKPIMTYLRSLGYVSVNYLDDILVLGNSLEACEKNVQATCELLEKLGLIINLEKSKLLPSTRCKFLGLIYDSNKLTVELPSDKKEKVIKLIEKYQKIKKFKIREFASFVGTLESCCPTLKYGRVHMRQFERERFLALRLNNDNFEKYMTISETAHEDLNWWSKNINSASNVIKTFDPIIEIFSDASLTGWGASCKGKRAHGHWSREEKSLHINVLELLAAFFALKCFASDLSDGDILLRLDNTTAMAYVNKKGGVRFPKLNKIAKTIWSWCEERSLWLYASYICSKDNFEADYESRRLDPETEYSLADKAFNKIKDCLGHPSIDLFASRINTKCEKYISWKKDPGASAIDAFTCNWNSNFFYAFPPFIIIPRVLEKIRVEKCKGIVVVPHWPAQIWFPIYMSMMVSRPIFFQPDTNLLLTLNRQPHPMWKKITLVAGILSGKHSD